MRNLLGLRGRGRCPPPIASSHSTSTKAGVSFFSASKLCSKEWGPAIKRDVGVWGSSEWASRFPRRLPYRDEGGKQGAGKRGVGCRGATSCLALSPVDKSECDNFDVTTRGVVGALG